MLPARPRSAQTPLVALLRKRFGGNRGGVNYKVFHKILIVGYASA
jgi:hypothetical protein